MALLPGSSDATLMPRVLAYYRQVAPVIAANLGATPFAYKNFPAGLDTNGAFHLAPYDLSANHLLWAIHARFAIEFFTWAPLPEDQHRLRFARLLLEPPPGVDFPRMRLAAQALRDVLRDVAKLHAVPLVGGETGIALWVPLADAPRAEPLRAWLDVLANHAAAAHPDLISTEVNTHHDGRVHLHVHSNAAGRYSAVPYSLRAHAMTVCTPVRWDELDGLTGADAFDADAVPVRLRELGDIFASEVAAIGEQRFADASAAPLLDGMMSTTPTPRGHVITAAIDILDDGKPRTADELLAEALARKLVPASTQRRYIYIALIEYIARQLGRGRKPPIVQDAQRRFRLNEPPDDWPDLLSPAEAPAEPAATALCARLDATATGTDPAAFEAAVCDAFAHMGFSTQHLGQHGQPDGIADAILGLLGYRLLLECKTAKTIVNQPDPAQAAKFREAFGAQFCALVGPEFPDEVELISELQTHRVTAIAVGELKTLLHVGANAHEVQRLLVPGYASDVIADLLWERRHGASKHVATVAELIVEEGWKAQVTAAEQGGPANAPRLTVDAAMVLVDAALRNAGSTQACTRAEVQTAFAWLASPNVGAALADGDALVILRPAGRNAVSLRRAL